MDVFKDFKKNIGFILCIKYQEYILSVLMNVCRRLMLAPVLFEWSLLVPSVLNLK